MSQPNRLLRSPDAPCRWLPASDDPTRAAPANQLANGRSVGPEAVAHIHPAAPKDLKTGNRKRRQPIAWLAAKTDARLKSP